MTREEIIEVSDAVGHALNTADVDDVLCDVSTRSPIHRIEVEEDYVTIFTERALTAEDSHNIESAFFSDVAFQLTTRSQTKPIVSLFMYTITPKQEVA